MISEFLAAEFIMSQESNNLIDKLDEIVQRRNIEQTQQINKYIDDISRKLSNNIEDNKEELMRLKGEHQNLKNQCKNLFHRLRRNNIVVYGLKVNQENLVESTVSELRVLLQTEISVGEINNIRLLGRSGEVRPILVEFLSYITKLRVLSHTKHLKGKKIFITHEMTREEIEDNKILRKHLKLSKQKGYKSYIKGNKLYIGDSVYTAEELRESVDAAEVADEELLKDLIVRKSMSDPSIASAVNMSSGEDSPSSTAGIVEADIFPLKAQANADSGRNKKSNKVESLATEENRLGRSNSVSQRPNTRRAKHFDKLTTPSSVPIDGQKPPEGSREQVKSVASKGNTIRIAN